MPNCSQGSYATGEVGKKLRRGVGEQSFLGMMGVLGMLPPGKSRPPTFFCRYVSVCSSLWQVSVNGIFRRGEFSGRGGGIFRSPSWGPIEVPETPRSFLEPRGLKWLSFSVCPPWCREVLMCQIAGISVPNCRHFCDRLQAFDSLCAFQYKFSPACVRVAEKEIIILFFL